MRSTWWFVMVAVLVASLAGFFAYNAGISQGLAQGAAAAAAQAAQAAPGTTPVPPLPPYYWYGWHRPWGFGFPFFFLFLFAWVFLFRGLCWGPRWRRWHDYREGVPPERPHGDPPITRA